MLMWGSDYMGRVEVWRKVGRTNVSVLFHASELGMERRGLLTVKLRLGLGDLIVS